MKKTFMSVGFALIFLGCATATPIEEVKKNNPRIVYRDLTKPKHQPPPQLPKKPQAKPNPVKFETGQPSYFVEFSNESYKSFDQQKLKRFMGSTPKDAMIVIIGHSHGKSAIGTLHLASKRAEAVSNHLIGMGYKNNHVMASWGPQHVQFSPVRGVHLYIFNTDDQKNNVVPIVFAKKTKQMNHGDTEVFDELGDV